MCIQNQNLKKSRRKIWDYVCILELEKDFLEKLHKSQAITEKMVKVNDTEFLNVWTPEDTIEEVKTWLGEEKCNPCNHQHYP